MELKLDKQLLIDIDIDGHSFKVDVKDARKMEALERWANNQMQMRQFTKEDMKECPELIDTILGEGAFETLFRGYENSSSQYELCFTLHELFKNEFLKEQNEQREQREKADLDKIDKLCNSMDRFNKTLEYADKKYGGGNAVAGAHRPSRKYRR